MFTSAKTYLPRVTSRQIMGKMAKSSYAVRQLGEQHTPEYKVYLEKDGKILSPFHDVPLHPTGKSTGNLFNMVVEVPRWTNAKLEISKEEKYNPIVQDVKKGKLRYVPNVFPFKGYIHNYGAFPQTWEDPTHKDKDTGHLGDSDPVDVCEIGQRVANIGEVVQVKVLGCLALLDEGETDWKIIAINTKDPLADKFSDIEDVEEHMPGLLKATRDWFRNYKVPDGKPRNEFAFNGEFKGREYALGVLNSCNKAWETLVEKPSIDKKISTANTTLEGTPAFQDNAGRDIPKGKIVPGKDDSLNEKWHYVSKL
ncbi:inorganic pyrophosphatase, mitochondrial [Trichomonascus vanleenenianus]|uniref:inorganic pyrophosphatase, mitochondrial n=1 Tax=Trichomonascus vanleenenianus TaxID=2268995 RepID=UPI003ECB30BC